MSGTELTHFISLLEKFFSDGARHEEVVRPLQGGVAKVPQFNAHAECSPSVFNRISAGEFFALSAHTELGNILKVLFHVGTEDTLDYLRPHKTESPNRQQKKYVAALPESQFPQ